MRIKKDMIVRKIGTDVILVPYGNAMKDHNGLFMLSETACFLWEQLPCCDCAEELAQKLYEEYDVTKEQAVADTEDFLGKLAQLDIIDNA